jgi:hypothetical protein
VADKNGVGAAGVEAAIGLVGEGERAQQAAALELQLDVEFGVFGFDDACGSAQLSTLCKIKKAPSHGDGKGPSDTRIEAAYRSGSVLISPLFSGAGIST